MVTWGQENEAEKKKEEKLNGMERNEEIYEPMKVGRRKGGKTLKSNGGMTNGQMDRRMAKQCRRMDRRKENRTGRIDR